MRRATSIGERISGPSPKRSSRAPPNAVTRKSAIERSTPRKSTGSNCSGASMKRCGGRRDSPSNVNRHGWYSRMAWRRRSCSSSRVSIVARNLPSTATSRNEINSGNLHANAA